MRKQRLAEIKESLYSGSVLFSLSFSKATKREGKKKEGKKRKERKGKERKGKEKKRYLLNHDLYRICSNRYQMKRKSEPGLSISQKKGLY